MATDQETYRCEEPRVPVSDELPCSPDPDEERCNEHISDRGKSPTSMSVNYEYNPKTI